MTLENLKTKIQLATDFIGGQGVRYINNSIVFSETDFNFYFNEDLTGDFQVINSGIVGDDTPLTDPTIRGDYRVGFERFVEQSLRRKQYKNLSYAETRFGVIKFEEDSAEFKEVIKNLTNDVLGPALDEFTLAQFDAQVSEAVNSKFSTGGTVELQDLPFLKDQGGTGNVSGTPTGLNSYQLIDPLSILALQQFEMKPDDFQNLNVAYFAQNGSSLEQQTANAKLDKDLQLKGNAGSITNEFKIDRVEAGGAGILDTIKDFFTDYTSPAGIISTRYKNFLVEALKNPQNIENHFSAQKDETRDDLIYYLSYDFEYERRIAIPQKVNELGPEATAEDILNAAENAALNSLAESGLAGAGGVGTLELDPETIKERQRFFEQCALLADMEQFQSIFTNIIREEGAIEDSESNLEPVPPPQGEKIHQPNPYQERFYMVEVPNGRNDRLVNFLNAPSGELINDFLNLTPDIQAFLLPKLRLFKVFNEGNTLKQTEFIFRNSTDSTNVLNQLFRDNDKFFRGSGYGIKSFSFSFNGTTPATAKNDITADLTLFFQDFSDFITPVETPQGTFSFVDLIFYDKKNENNPTFGYGNSHPDQYSPAYYRIRADVGWQVPENLPQFDDACRKRGIDPDNVRDVIEKTNKSYYLNMVEHELDFKKDGTVEIKAQYRGYIESVLKGTTMDALTDQALISERKSRQQQLQTARRSCTPGELAKIKRIYAAEEQVIIQDLYQRTYKRLLDLGRVRTFSVNHDGGFRKNGFFEKKPNLSDLGNDDTTQINDEHNYYFLGDLLYVMLDSVYADNGVAEPLGKTKFILPTIEFENFFEDTGVFSINVAQIPISHRYFTEWWSEHVIKAKKRSYPIMFYLRDLLNNLIADALIDTCLNKNYKKSFNFQTTTVNASGDPLANKASSIDPIIDLDQNDLPFTVDEGSDINDITNYVLVYAAHSTTLPSGTGKYTEDIKNGVYHFHLGQDRGLINDVKFNKVDMAYIREARYLREGIDGLLQLGAVYRASINMFGNTLFYPGMLIYINPFGIGGEQFLPNDSNTIANKLGLGGYHLIEKVNSSVGGGVFKTSIDAMFVYSGDGDTRVNIQGKQEEDNQEDVTKPEKIDPTCPNLVSAVRADYLNALAGQETDLAGDIENRLTGSPLTSPTLTGDTDVVGIEAPDTDGDGIPDSIDLTPNGETQ
jgi:hypothetical protein